ncbi:MAG: DNA polymerase III subunit beta [Weeksellaceae bacterium]|nr:DNA polymerase III subunit beta [Weeksellaceae bacterium]
MKFIVASSQLNKCLSMIGGIINPNSTHNQMLENYLFELDNNKLKITGTDLETIVTSSLEVESDSVDEICIPSRILQDIIKTFPDQPLTFKVEENNLVEIISDEGNFSLGYLSAEDYPALPIIEDPIHASINADILKEGLSKTVFATGTDDHRPVMSGVYFEWTQEKLNFVATDAHKLVVYSREDLQVPQDIKFILTRKPLQLIKNIFDSNEEISMEVDHKHAIFKGEKTTLITRHIDGKYPNYSAVIPTKNPYLLTINRSMFLSALRRVAIFANKSSSLVRLNISSSQLIISAEDQDFNNKAKERVPCDYSGEDMNIGFNARFLSEVLSNLDSEEVTVALSDPARAGIVKPIDGLAEGEDILMLVMPLMLSV